MEVNSSGDFEGAREILEFIEKWSALRFKDLDGIGGGYTEDVRVFDLNVQTEGRTVYRNSWKGCLTSVLRSLIERMSRCQSTSGRGSLR